MQTLLDMLDDGYILRNEDCSVIIGLNTVKTITAIELFSKELIKKLASKKDYNFFKESEHCKYLLYYENDFRVCDKYMAQTIIKEKIYPLFKAKGIFK